MKNLLLQSLKKVRKTHFKDTLNTLKKKARGLQVAEVGLDNVTEADASIRLKGGKKTNKIQLVLLPEALKNKMTFIPFTLSNKNWRQKWEWKLKHEGDKLRRGYRKAREEAIDNLEKMSENFWRNMDYYVADFIAGGWDALPDAVKLILETNKELKKEFFKKVKEEKERREAHQKQEDEWQRQLEDWRKKEGISKTIVDTIKKTAFSWNPAF